MTTILPPQDLSILRAVAKSAAVLFTWMMIERLYPDRPVTEYQFADLLSVDIRTVQKQLRSLSSAGLALFQGNSTWVLTPNGRNTLFGVRDTSLLSIEETTPLYLEEGVTANFATQNVPHDDDEYIHTNFVIESPSINERTFCATTKQILQHTNLLFGSSVSINRTVESRDPLYALCWVSKAWADRKKLQNPAGLVYKRLMNNEHPPVHLRDDPFAGLPEDYLQAIGHQSAVVVIEPLEDDNEPETEPVQLDDSPAAQVWSIVSSQLQTEMPRASFETFVQDLQARGMEGGILTVRARSNNVCEWVESRLESTINRMLIGICSEDVHIKFEVS